MSESHVQLMRVSVTDVIVLSLLVLVSLCVFPWRNSVAPSCHFMQSDIRNKKLPTGAGGIVVLSTWS